MAASDSPHHEAAARARAIGLRFPLVMLAILGGLGLLLSTVGEPFYTALHTRLSLATAVVVGHLMNPLGTTVQAGAHVIHEGFAVQIVGECVGLYEIFIFSACVLAYPATWAQRARGLVLGSGLILVFNLLRIVALLLVGAHAPEWFDFFHLYFWQTTLVLLVGAAWLAWIRWVLPC